MAEEQKKGKAQNKKQEQSQGEQTQGDQVSQAQIEEWKRKYGAVWLFQTDDGKKCYLKKPDRATLGTATKTAKNDPMKFNEVILQNCWLAGDDEIKTDDDYFLAISQQLDELISFKEVEVKKL